MLKTDYYSKKQSKIFVNDNYKHITWPKNLVKKISFVFFTLNN